MCPDPHKTPISGNISDSNPLLKRRLAAVVLAALLGSGIAPFAASPAFAQDSERIADEKVPAPVRATARANALDSRDVDYRKFDETGRYQVNFTTPANLRLQLIINKEGELVAGPRLAPTQVAGGPAAGDRERLLGDWIARVRNAQATAAAAAATPPPAVPPNVPTPTPPVAVPGQVPAPPTTPGAVAAPAARPLSTEIRAADLPAPALKSLDRFTNGGKHVNYYRVTVEDRARYQAMFTAADGSRQEVTVADNGSLMSGPLVMTAQIDDRSLQMDGPDNLKVATSARVEPSEIPARAMDAISKYVKTGSDVRYRKDTFADGSVGYTAHWIQTDNSRRYFLTVAENGDLRQAAKLSMYQPAAAPGAQENGVAVSWTDLPDRVRKTLEPLTRADAKARYFKQSRDNKISYGSIYHSNGHEMWVRVDEAGETIVNPVSAQTGKPIDTSEPAKAAARVSPAMLQDRLNFSELPAPVKEKVLKETTGSKDVINMKHDRAGRAVYHTVWTDAAGRQQELYLDARGEAVPAPKSN
ncbi:hypothetical protein [Humisphaera borealis]|uniref:PepSY domain-containing protein n=1 Tax=Humisphaera borealis TaxID=2807512 RepID=A0A7M2X223_9BACT|nr:hypothetical protein [Humisphaera borealis]QOV91714.1 hypothetical protein IPV69_10280 [Humisphaera borealis]